jgi:hypothetical protein
MGRLPQLIRDLFSAKCSQTEALRLLLKSAPIASITRKPGNSEGSVIRKVPSGRLVAIWGAITELIVYWKIAISRRRA